MAAGQPFDLEGCDSLIHLGYRLPLTTNDSERIAEEFATNVADTLHLLREAERHGIEHVCFASSALVYRPSLEPAVEDGATEPQNAYAVAKLAQEACIRFFSRRTGRPTAILRLTTVYGPGERVSRAVPNFIRSALRQQPLVLDGLGRQPFDLVYVADVAQAFVRATAAMADGTFNIGSGRLCTPRELAERVIALCGEKLPIIEDNRRKERGGAACDIRRAKRAFNFRADTTLDEGLAAEIAWLRDEEQSLARMAAAALPR